MWRRADVATNGAGLRSFGACRGKTSLAETIPFDADVHALIARGCVMRWSDALSTAVLTLHGFTRYFRSVRDIRTPCADRQH